MKEILYCSANFCGIFVADINCLNSLYKKRVKMESPLKYYTDKLLVFRWVLIVLP